MNQAERAKAVFDQLAEGMSESKRHDAILVWHESLIENAIMLGHAKQCSMGRIEFADGSALYQSHAKVHLA